jgi:sialate O-acetylesterase
MDKRFFLILLCACFAPLALLRAEVRLSGLFGNSMILQRDAPVKVWGWADKNERIRLQFNGQTLTTRAKADGSWETILSPMPFGGPYVMKVTGKHNTIELTDILIGDVWLCSGQSNMEWTVGQSANAAEETAAAAYPEIRSLHVPKGIKAEPQSNFNAAWVVCSPATVGDFSGVAYFYARELYRELKIPIGIINASWGGTDIETWISENAFIALPENIRKKYNAEVRSHIDDYIKNNTGNRQTFLNAMKNDPALVEKWFGPVTDRSSWQPITVPAEWAATPLALIDGQVWFSCEITLSAEMAGKPARLSLGTIDDSDITWINGIQVGENSGWDTPRLYAISDGILKEGINNIVVRITDNGGSGGMWSQPEDIFLEVQNEKIPLAGQWKYKISVSNADYKVLDITPNMLYASLYNTMINPVIKFRIKGVVWYQGENNTGRAYAYRTLFPALITDWRNKWGYEFPFYWVQLANLYPLNETPVESAWAELREAQTMTLSLPKTGQAVTCDIGNPNDIHPTNKQDVGRRLARIALHNDYGKTEIIYSGPTFQSVEIIGNKAVITMNTHGSVLAVHNKYGYLEGFAIAGEDKKFEWAKATVEGNKIIVYSTRVDHPVAVRYGWANNPGGNLFNTENLPAVPFRTDNWPGITIDSGQ